MDVRLLSIYTLLQSPSNLMKYLPVSFILPGVFDKPSPFLFTLGWMLKVISKEIEGRLFQGFEVGEDSILVSHLQYADDTILFLEADMDGLYNLRHVLRWPQAWKWTLTRVVIQSANLCRKGGNCRGFRPLFYEWPISNLELLLEGKIRSMQFWAPVLRGFKKD